MKKRILQSRQDSEQNKTQKGDKKMAENRLIGGYPVIGIRPTIDGRRKALEMGICFPALKGL